MSECANCRCSTFVHANCDRCGGRPHVVHRLRNERDTYYCQDCCPVCKQQQPAAGSARPRKDNPDAAIFGEAERTRMKDRPPKEGELARHPTTRGCFLPSHRLPRCCQCRRRKPRELNRLVTEGYLVQDPNLKTARFRLTIRGWAVVRRVAPKRATLEPFDDEEE